MNLPSSALEKVVEELSRFPGIGKKSALRMTLFLLRSDEQVVRSMTDAILAMKERTSFCSRCGNITEEELCRICTSVNRRQDTICVVRDFQDVIAIENTSRYNGLYHVLGGLISPMQGIGPSDIRIEQLLKRVETEPISELIMALSANMEGETTEFYISRKLDSSKVQISSIARGISVGGELEYADEITLGRSIVNRVPYKISGGDGS
ncbi:MAG: recombination protein RecR [Flavobacteriales bacterium]|nr:recombination protein RecR [Flavobacteriales bacterium]